MYTYQVDWFSAQLSIWEHHLSPYKDKPDISFLEIGSFEGRSAVWLLTNVLTHRTARLTCIDPFHGSVENQHKDGLDLTRIESNFDHNIRETGVAEKVTKIKEYSSVAYPQLAKNRFDMIYIDGSHAAEDVLSDAVMYWHLLKKGGLMIFDDYEWDEPGMTGLATPRPAIDAFLHVYRESMEIQFIGIQVVVKRTA